MSTERVAVRGSERIAPLDSNVIGVADPNAEVSVTIVVRRRTEELPAPGSRPIARDKKVAAGTVGFVLLESAGRPVAGVAVPVKLQSEVIAWLLNR